jgi:hypothetical protein
MKLLKIILILSLYITFSYAKVKIMKTQDDQTNNPTLMLRGTTQPPQESSDNTIYITLIEGSKDTYTLCNSICLEKNEQLYYTEVTEFPGHGKIFRCQCGDRYTSWYNFSDLSEMCVDILMGDKLFNGYINLLGYDRDDCNCNDLKLLLAKLLPTPKTSADQPFTVTVSQSSPISQNEPKSENQEMTGESVKMPEDPVKNSQLEVIPVTPLTPVTSVIPVTPTSISAPTAAQSINTLPSNSISPNVGSATKIDPSKASIIDSLTITKSIDTKIADLSPPGASSPTQPSF